MDKSIRQSWMQEYINRNAVSGLYDERLIEELLAYYGPDPLMQLSYWDRRLELERRAIHKRIDRMFEHQRILDALKETGFLFVALPDEAYQRKFVIGIDPIA